MKYVNRMKRDWETTKHIWKLTWRHKVREGLTFLFIFGIGFSLFFGGLAFLVQCYIWLWAGILFLAGWQN